MSEQMDKHPLDFPFVRMIGQMQVAARMVADGAIHIIAWHTSGRRPTFYELQLVKATIVGPETQAVEIYPPESELVDEGGNSGTHLWVLPPHARLPYVVPKPKVDGAH